MVSRILRLSLKTLGVLLALLVLTLAGFLAALDAAIGGNG